MAKSWFIKPVAPPPYSGKRETARRRRQILGLAGARLDIDNGVMFPWGDQHRQAWALELPRLLAAGRVPAESKVA